MKIIKKIPTPPLPPHNEIIPHEDVSSFHFGIVCGQFNQDISHGLLSGTLSTLTELGVTRPPDVVWSPGAFELPLTAEWMLTYQPYTAIIALGAIIRGDTPHFEYVSAACARGIQTVSLSTQTPILFGVLTTNTEDEARARSQNNEHNKGHEVAIAAVRMGQLYHFFIKEDTLS